VRVPDHDGDSCAWEGVGERMRNWAEDQRGWFPILVNIIYIVDKSDYSVDQELLHPAGMVLPAKPPSSTWASMRSRVSNPSVNHP